MFFSQKTVIVQKNVNVHAGGGVQTNTAIGGNVFAIIIVPISPP